MRGRGYPGADVGTGVVWGLRPAPARVSPPPPQGLAGPAPVVETVRPRPGRVLRQMYPQPGAARDVSEELVREDAEAARPHHGSGVMRRDGISRSESVLVVPAQPCGSCLPCSLRQRGGSDAEAPAGWPRGPA